MSIFFILTAYLIGSIPFGLLVSKKVTGLDIREHGSGNIGATNVFRVAGKPWGILVFLLDAAKGFFAVRFPDAFLDTPGSTSFALVLGIAALLGHSFPVWLSFRGGKGVAASLGIFLAIAFWPALITFGLWIAVFAATRIISISSLAAALMFPLVILLTCREQEGFAWLLAASFLLTGFMFFTHRANIRRLLNHEEKKLF